MLGSKRLLIVVTVSSILSGCGGGSGGATSSVSSSSASSSSVSSSSSESSSSASSSSSSSTKDLRIEAGSADWVAYKTEQSESWELLQSGQISLGVSGKVGLAYHCSDFLEIQLFTVEEVEAAAEGLPERVVQLCGEASSSAGTTHRVTWPAAENVGYQAYAMRSGAYSRSYGADTGTGQEWDVPAGIYDVAQLTSSTESFSSGATLNWIEDLEVDRDLTVDFSGSPQLSLDHVVDVVIDQPGEQFYSFITYDFSTEASSHPSTASLSFLNPNLYHLTVDSSRYVPLSVFQHDNNRQLSVATALSPPAESSLYYGFKAASLSNFLSMGSVTLATGESFPFSTISSHVAGTLSEELAPVTIVAPHADESQYAPTFNMQELSFQWGRDMDGNWGLPDYYHLWMVWESGTEQDFLSASISSVWLEESNDHLQLNLSALATLAGWQDEWVGGVSAGEAAPSAVNVSLHASYGQGDSEYSADTSFRGFGRREISGSYSME